MKTLALLMVAGSLLLAGCAAPPAAVSHDGLHLVENSDWDQLYIKPDLRIADYDAFTLQPCTVAFRDKWMRDQNSQRRRFGRSRITERDVQEIQERFAAVCDEYFERALREEPAYRLVSEPDGQSRVLELRPAIIDLDLNAPDVDEVGIVRTYTTSFGEMTLLLEAYDGLTGEIVARIVDRKVDYNDQHLEWTNRVTNMADARRFMRSWTRSLRKSLDASR